MNNNHVIMETSQVSSHEQDVSSSFLKIEMPRVLVTTIFTIIVILNLHTTDLTSRLNSAKKVTAKNLSNQFIPDLYMITPTYTRVTQQSDLTNVIQSAVLSDLKIQLIIVEDTNNKHPSAVVQDLAHQFSFPKTRTNITLLQCASSTKKWNKRMRGVRQRNAALEWVSKHQKNESAMVYRVVFLKCHNLG